MRFAIIGAAGYIAPRHMQAIKDVGGELVAATDPHDSVGVLDRYNPECTYFREIERFDRHLEKLRQQNKGVDWIVVCSPNYLHDAHVRLGLRLGANVLCEKPLVINPWNLDALERIEESTGRRVYTVLQLRCHKEMERLRAEIGNPRQVSLKYHTPRGRWYAASWKGDDRKSGGILCNIGIHLFDLLSWMFGPIDNARSYDTGSDAYAAGFLEIGQAEILWYLGIGRDKSKPTRTLCIDEAEHNIEGFDGLHTEVYRRTLAGKGFGISDARPSIEIVRKLRYPDEAKANGIA